MHNGPLLIVFWPGIRFIIPACFRYHQRIFLHNQLKQPAPILIMDKIGNNQTTLTYTNNVIRQKFTIVWIKEVLIWDAALLDRVMVTRLTQVQELLPLLF